MAKTPHYVAAYYSLGCVADTCSVFTLRASAVDYLLELVGEGENTEQDERIEQELRANWFAEVRAHKHDLYRVSVVACTCNAPWEHDENMTEEDWREMTE
jgi:hypothetical protein